MLEGKISNLPGLPMRTTAATMASQLAPLPSTRTQSPGFALGGAVSGGGSLCSPVTANAVVHDAPADGVEEEIEDDIVEESIDDDEFEQEEGMSTSGMGTG